MPWSDCKHQLAIIASVLLVANIAGAQGMPSVVPPVLRGTSSIRPPGLSGLTFLSSPVDTVDRPGQAGNATAGPPGRQQRITLQQVKQHSANRVASPLAYMGHLSVEAARQHRLGVQADYFPKFGATFVNLHFTDFMGEIF